MTTLWILILALVAALALPFVLEWRKKDPDPEEAPGEFVELSQGKTHYRWLGPVRGPVIIAIHGLTTPSVIWESIAASFGKLGYRTLVYDLYGRGYSDAPRGAQNAAFFHRQLDELLAQVGLSDELTVMGYSMGGSIATSWAALNPERVRQVVLVASTGVETVEAPESRWIQRVPLLGGWLHRVMSGRQARATFDDGESEVANLAEAQAAQYQRKGFVQAVLSSRRGILSQSMEDAHRKLFQTEIPVFAVWGKQDAIIPISALGKLAQWNRDAHQAVIDEADHGLPYTHGRQAVSELRDLMIKVRPE